MSVYNSTFSLLPSSDVPCFYFSFIDFFSKEESEYLVELVTPHFSKDLNQQFIQVWDCTEMSSFEMGAKNAWQKMLKLYKTQIHSVYLISDNQIIRLAGRLMSAVVNFPLHILKSNEGLPTEITSKIYEAKLVD